MPMRRPRKRTKTDPVMVTGEGLTPEPGDSASGSDEEPSVSAVYLSPDHRYLAVVTESWSPVWADAA